MSDLHTASIGQITLQVVVNNTLGRTATVLTSKVCIEIEGVILTLVTFNTFNLGSTLARS